MRASLLLHFLKTEAALPFPTIVAAPALGDSDVIQGYLSVITIQSHPLTFAQCEKNISSIPHAYSRNPRTNNARLPSTRLAGLPAHTASTNQARRLRLQTRVQPRRPLDRRSATARQPGIDAAADALRTKRPKSRPTAQRRAHRRARRRRWRAQAGIAAKTAPRRVRREGADTDDYRTGNVAKFVPQ